VSGGGKTFVNVATGRCLDDSTAFGQDVLRGYECIPGDEYQQWAESFPNPYNTSVSMLRNIATNRCLDDSTAFGKDVLRAIPCNDLNYQRWFTGLGN
jgi:hypothetical protein